jgi:hypothetical protein
LSKFATNISGKPNSFDRADISPSSLVSLYFWLGNVGARSLLVEDLRLVLTIQDGLDFKAYPVHSVPLEAIEMPAEFHDYERLRLGGPFSGFSLAAEQQWISSYHYHISDECYGKLRGDVKTYIQYRAKGKKQWYTAFSDLLQFGSDPHHFRELTGKEQAIFIYPKRWKEREK